VEGSLHITVVNEVYRVVVGNLWHPDQFTYIDCWWDAVFTWLTWLRPGLEEACRIMVVRVAASSKCREKTKEAILAEEPEEVPPPYVTLYPPLPPVPRSAPLPSTWDEEAQGTLTLVKSGSEDSVSSTLLTFPVLWTPYPLEICQFSLHILHSIRDI
jgi:hypothetical protein